MPLYNLIKKLSDSMGRPKKIQEPQPVSGETEEEYEEVEQDIEASPPEPPKLQKPTPRPAPSTPRPPQRAPPQAQEAPTQQTPEQILMGNPNPPLTIDNVELLNQGDWYFFVMYDTLGKAYNLQLQFHKEALARCKDTLNGVDF